MCHIQEGAGKNTPSERTDLRGSKASKGFRHNDQEETIYTSNKLLCASLSLSL